MPTDVPLIWLLAAFNALFLAAYIYRRMTGRPPLNGVLAILAQTSFIAINCMALFPEEVAHVMRELMRLI